MMDPSSHTHAEGDGLLGCIHCSFISYANKLVASSLLGQCCIRKYIQVHLSHFQGPVRESWGFLTLTTSQYIMVAVHLKTLGNSWLIPVLCIFQMEVFTISSFQYSTISGDITISNFVYQGPKDLVSMGLDHLPSLAI